MKKEEFIEIYNRKEFISFKKDLELLIHNEITLHEIKRALALQNKIKESK